MYSLLKTYFQHPQSMIVGVGFASLSFLMSAFAIRLPELKADLQINDAQLGTALLILSIASLVVSPFSSYVIDRMGTGKAGFTSVILLAIFYILPFLVSEYRLFLGAMLFLGLASGFINITLNASAAIVEKTFDRSIMSSCHGMFSIGAILGAVSAGFISGWGISPLVHISLVISLILFINILFQSTWLSIPVSSLKAPVFTFPKRPILAFTFITFCIVLSEMTIMDWSAVYLRDTLESPAALTGLGFAGFSLTMAIGRMSGDIIVLKVGKQRIVLIGCILAGIGLSIAAATNIPLIAITGFTICGLGMATIVPLIYSISAKMETISPAIGIASIATACVMGGLVSRPMTGLISEWAGMSVSMWIAAAFCFIAGIVVWWRKN